MDALKWNGMVALIKPRGLFSKAVERRLKNVLGKVKMGYAGTLDPMAEGVLPILVGSATRLQDYLVDLPKAYRFRLQFGLLTDTLDETGTVLEIQDDVCIDADRIRDAIQAFQGDILQTPPLYSALKYKGKPLYKYARQGVQVPVEIKRRTVHIKSLKFLSLENNIAEFEVHCSKGTYVRSLGLDIAQRLGWHGTVVSIQRILASGIPLSSAISIEDINKVVSEYESFFIPIKKMSLGLPHCVIASKERINKLQKGQKLSFEAADITLDSWPDTCLESEVLLIDAEGHVFGLGYVAYQGKGSAEICMRRSLL